MFHLSWWSINDVIEGWDEQEVIQDNKKKKNQNGETQSIWIHLITYNQRYMSCISYES